MPPVTVMLPTAPKLVVPETVKLLNVPTDVILGCAFVYTVPAINALPTCPETLAPATALAVVANATAPETLAPATALAVAAKFT